MDTILTDMELHEVPRLLVLNKWDTLDEETREALRAVHPDAITLSAATRQGLDELVASIAARIDWERDLRPCGKRAGKGGGEGDGNECPADDGNEGSYGANPDEAGTDEAEAGYDWPEMESDRLN